MQKFFSLALAPLCLSLGVAQTSGFRPPSVPLITHDPMFSIWSPSDALNGSETVHWTRQAQPLASLIRVDGKTFRLMGARPVATPPMPQTGLSVTPTRSIYRFANAEVTVEMTFMSPLLPGDLDVMTRPVTYVTWAVRSADGHPHRVEIFDSAAAAITVNQTSEPVTWQPTPIRGLAAVMAGAARPTLLRPAGDDTRINWGNVYLAAPSAGAATGSVDRAMAEFSETGTLTRPDRTSNPRPADDDRPGLALSFDLGTVGAAAVERHAMVALDEIYAIEFLGQKQRPYWRRDGATMETLLPRAEREYPAIRRRCEAFDAQLISDATKLGGAKYAQIAALAYRQALAGCGYSADSRGMPMIYTKENSSNGCIATTDVFFPAAPQFLLMGSAFAKGLVAPVLVYAASPQWKYRFAPHDIGTYPRANGQVYGGSTEADMMPVEESGNMLILMLAIAKMDGNPGFASRYWRQLTEWEAYLEKYGKDPENQLCTDDFMGHLAHNSNLSVKAILAIASYGELCRMRGETDRADKYQRLAREYAQNWMKVAGDGDHTNLAFDRANTWSQKYNLVWDRILRLDVFPASVAAREVAYYVRQLQPFGLPLDSRTRLSKTDWSVWSATMATRPADFERIVSPIYDYLNVTSARLPFCDSYFTDNPASDGMRARPVIGGVFIKMIADPATWQRYAAAGAKMGNAYASAPVPPVETEVVATSRRTPQTWRFTTTLPASGWSDARFDDSKWQTGKGGFGTAGTPGAVIGTTWDTSDIWIRRTVTVPTGATGEWFLSLHHDEDVTVYIDGVLAAREGGYVGSYEVLGMSPAARQRLRPGAKVVIAAHCHQTGGGQFLDIGIVSVKPARK